jgi:hypothetical protein
LNNEVTKEQSFLQAAAEEGQGGARNPEVRNPKSEGQSQKPTKAGESRGIQANPRDAMAEIEEIVEADLAWEAMRRAEESNDE